jgi:hypothetical protein
MSVSEVATFRQQQALEEESARNALYGTAMIGGHDHIIARMECGGRVLLDLFESGQGMKALAIWENGFFEQVGGSPSC